VYLSLGQIVIWEDKIAGVVFLLLFAPCAASFSHPSQPRPIGDPDASVRRLCQDVMAQDSKMTDATSHSISLSGSAELVAEFFLYGVNTLLFQRGIYPPEKFIRVSKYGMTILVSQDEKVKEYLTSVLDQMQVWLGQAQLDRVVVVIASVATSTVLERWAFNVNTTRSTAPDEATVSKSEALATKPQSKIVAEIQALIRQITASVTFLPLLDEPCSFDILIYTKQDAETPVTWEESGPRIIPNASQVQLRSFSTSVHNVDACVAYACEEKY
jgi:mitotic spindle assembly checkpoint protein MAD2